MSFARMVLIATALASPAAAEELRGGMRSFLTIGGGFVWDDNPDLAVTQRGEIGPLAQLRFGLMSDTRRQSFTLQGGIDLRGSDVEEGRVDLSYTVTSTQSELGFAAYAERLSDGSFDDTLDAGDVTKGHDVVELLPRGRAVTTAGVQIGLEAGLRKSLGYDLRMRQDHRRYSGIAPRDFEQTSIEAGVMLRFSKNTEARVHVDRRRIKSTGAVARDWESYAVGIAVAHQIDSVTRVSGGFGYRRIEGMQVGASFNRRGTELRFNLTRERSDGELYVDAIVGQQSLGRRATLRFGVKKGVERIGLSFWAGATGSSVAKTELIGGVHFHKTVDKGRVLASVERDVTLAPDSDDNWLTDRVGVEWDQHLSARGALNLRADYLRTYATLADVEREGVRLQMVYRHAMRRDWGVKVGARLRARREAGGTRTQSRSVFLTFEKRFEALQ